jgi:hypothetical protein
LTPAVRNGDFLTGPPGADTGGFNVHTISPIADCIDQHLSEISGLVEALIFIQEEAEPAKLQSLHSSVVTLLYVATDKIKIANAGVARLPRG